jgi:hypothetical protein
MNEGNFDLRFAICDLRLATGPRRAKEAAANELLERSKSLQIATRKSQIQNP